MLRFRLRFTGRSSTTRMVTCFAFAGAAAAADPGSAGRLERCSGRRKASTWATNVSGSIGLERYTETDLDGKLRSIFAQAVKLQTRAHRPCARLGKIIGAISQVASVEDVDVTRSGLQ